MSERDGMDEMQRRVNEALANWEGDPRDAAISRLAARVKELEEALGWYASDANWLNPERARAALTPQPEKKPRKKRGFVWPKGAPEDGR